MTGGESGGDDPAGGERGARRVRVVVAEDNPGDVRLLEEALAGLGRPLEVCPIADGLEVLRFVRREGPHAERPVPDLFLLDLNLPKHDGREILVAIRASADLARVPVVVLTSSGAPHDRRELLRLGADRFVRKPCRLDELVAVGRVVAALLP